MNLSRCPSLRELLDFERRSYDDLLRKTKRISRDLKIANAKIKKNKGLIQSLKRQRSYLVSKLKSVEYNFEKLKESIDKFDERNQTGFPRFQSGQTSIGKMCVYRQLGNLP